jgi:branched-chain amino acid transport system permease protein
MTATLTPAPESVTQTVRPGPPWRTVAGLALTLLLLIVYPFALPSVFAANIGILALTFATAAVGWNLLGGYTGQVSFGQALFFGIGAYTTALGVRAGWSPWLTFVVGSVLAAGVAVLVMWPTSRLRNHYFSIATIAVTQIVMILVTNIDWLGRASGLELPIPDHNGLAALSFNPRDKTPYYFVALGMFVVAWLAGAWLLRGRLGVYAMAVRDDQEAAAAIGVSVRQVKLVMAALSGSIAAIPGGFFAMYVSLVDPPSVLGLNLSIQIALIAVLGGVGTLAGPLLGAWTLIFLQEYTRSELSSTGRSLDLLIYGALIVLVTLVEPGGIVGLAQRMGRRLFAAARRPRPGKGKP